MKNEYTIIDNNGNDAVTDLGKGSKEFRVSICYEQGAVINVKADSPEEAEAKLKAIMDYSGLTELENDPTFNGTNRDYWAQDLKEGK